MIVGVTSNSELVADDHAPTVGHEVWHRHRERIRRHRRRVCAFLSRSIQLRPLVDASAMASSKNPSSLQCRDDLFAMSVLVASSMTRTLPGCPLDAAPDRKPRLARSPTGDLVVVIDHAGDRSLDPMRAVLEHDARNRAAPPRRPRACRPPQRHDGSGSRQPRPVAGRVPYRLLLGSCRRLPSRTIVWSFRHASYPARVIILDLDERGVAGKGHVRDGAAVGVEVHDHEPADLVERDDRSRPCVDRSRAAWDRRDRPHAVRACRRALATAARHRASSHRDDGLAVGRDRERLDHPRARRLDHAAQRPVGDDAARSHRRHRGDRGCGRDRRGGAAGTYEAGARHATTAINGTTSFIYGTSSQTGETPNVFTIGAVS